MKLRRNLIITLLIAMGYIIHQVMPGTIGSMKFDVMLSFIFISILITRDFKSTILTALLGGMITAMTTTFPGGQIPNIMDKLVSCLAVYALLKITAKMKNQQIVTAVIAFIGTIVSGSVFLYTALIMVGLPAPFMVLFLGIVLPTAFTNVFVTLMVLNAVKVAIKAAGIKYI